MSVIRKLAAAAFGSHSSILIALLAAGIAGLFAWGAAGRADRDRAIATADTICAAGGSAWSPADGEDGRRGEACRAAALRRSSPRAPCR